MLSIICWGARSRIVVENALEFHGEAGGTMQAAAFGNRTAAILAIEVHEAVVALEWA